MQCNAPASPPSTSSARTRLALRPESPALSGPLSWRTGLVPDEGRVEHAHLRPAAPPPPTPRSSIELRSARPNCRDPNRWQKTPLSCVLSPAGRRFAASRPRRAGDRPGACPSNGSIRGGAARPCGAHRTVCLWRRISCSRSTAGSRSLSPPSCCRAPSRSLIKHDTRRAADQRRLNALVIEWPNAGAETPTASRQPPLTITYSISYSSMFSTNHHEVAIDRPS